MRHFGGDPGAIGRSIRIDDLPFTVIGVAAPEFTGTVLEPAELWVPLAALPLLNPEGTWAMDVLEKPAHCCSAIAGRLAPGVTRAQARAELDVLHRQFQATIAAPTNGIHLGGTAFFSQTPAYWQEISGVLGLMFGAVTLVLVLACANVGNLLLARALSRQREISIRLSIGASRRRVVRQLLTEALVLATLAGALALGVASTAPRWLALAVGELSSLTLSPDLTVLGYTAALSLATCVLFGLAPALKATRLAGAAIHRLQPRTAFVSLRGALLTAQVALSLVLLVGASLLVRGVQHAWVLDPGFRIDGVSVASIRFPPRVYDNPARARAFLDQTIAAMKDAPGLWPAALTASVPLGASHNFGPIRRHGEPESAARMIELQEVSPAYFDVLQIPIAAGPAFEDRDAGQPYVLINEALAAELWPGQIPLGQVLAGTPPREIIGVVRDTRVAGLHRVEPMVYGSFSGRHAPRLLVRELDASALARLSALVARLDARVTVGAKPLRWYAERWIAPSRVGAALALLVGLLALCLATTGVFGVFAYMVEERRHEIGIRLALGARARHVVRLVLGSAGRALVSGLALGLLTTLLLTPALDAYLFGVSRFDTAAYASAAGLLALAALVARYVPATRALGVDPVTTLRNE